MPQQNERQEPEPERPRGVAVDLQRAAWLGGASLIVIALTAASLSFVTSGPRDHPLTAVAIGIEIALLLSAMWWFVPRTVGRTRALERETLHKARLVALLDASLASSPVGFAFFDQDLRFLRVNAALARMTGLAAEDHVGLSWHDIDRQFAASVEPTAHRVLATHDAVSNVELEASLPGTGGEARRWLTSWYPIITADGDLFGVGAAITDVTDEKLLEKQLVQAQKMEAVGRLAGGVAHDFNNLLTVISSFAELILYDPEMAKGHEEVEEIRGAAARAAKLTRQLLAFSRSQAMEPRIVNPNDVLRGVETLLRRLVIGNVEIITGLSTETPLVRVDPGQLEQVVMNLAINASDAMPDGGRLHIETAGVALGEDYHRRDPEVISGNYAMIRVADTGHGMDAGTMAQIFEPFFTTKEPGRGTGLGLSTVYGIVKQFGGHVDVTSEPGAGSVFTVYLPTIPDAEPLNR
jgi:PAS domain S-box-containing protein